ncbi:MAG: hypothetical protein KC431_01165, partial [Myxococcales bacterium]|nr:hypothetical protein [Myxococcales bacterium]
WSRAAKNNPDQYLDALIYGLAPLVHETTYEQPGRFRHDTYSHYTLQISRRPDRDDDALLAIGAALSALAATDHESFWTWVERLEPIDHDVIQSLVLGAMCHVVERDSARVVAFVRADPRRWLLERTLPGLLSALAQRLDEDQASELWSDIQAVERNDLAEYGPGAPDQRRYLFQENLAYRMSLLSALSDAPLPKDAFDAIAQWSRRGEPVEVRKFGVYSIHQRSPYSRAQFAHMSDPDLLAALARWPDDHSERRGETLEVTSARMRDELQHFATDNGLRALGLLAQLPDSGQFEAAAALLSGASKDLNVDSNDLYDAVVAAWHRGFHVHRYFRNISVDLLGQNASQLSNAQRTAAITIVGEALTLDWGSDHHQPAEAVPNNQRLFPSAGSSYGIPNIYVCLRAAVQLQLSTDDTSGWLSCLGLLDAQVEHLPANCWRLLLSHDLWPGSALAPRWVAWLVRLFEHHPAVLGTREGAYQLWRVESFVDELQLRTWLDMLRDSAWPSGARAADELTTMLACRSEHRSWARPLVEDWLTQSLDEHATGLVHGLATFRNDSTSPTTADWALVRLVEHASTDTVDLLLRILHRDGLRMTDTLLDALLTLEARGIGILPTARGSLMAGLTEFIDTRPADVARAAHHIASSEPIGSGLMRDDHLVSIAIGLHGKREQRAIGMELFELWQEFDPGAARSVLAESDSAQWAAADLDGVRAPSSLGSIAVNSRPSILYATASPISQPLDIERELKMLRSVIGDHCSFKDLVAVQRREFLDGVRAHRPTMVVFSG